MISDDEWGHKVEKGLTVSPYMDVVLKNNPQEYMAFVHRLFEGGMVNFTANPQDLVCPFFVVKKNQRLRLVLDCRSVNQRFADPPSLLMAAGATWANVELDGASQPMFVAQSDIKDYFYSLGLPEELQGYFSLPAIPVEAMRHWGVSSSHWNGLDREGLVAPCFRVVPMGWSWAMYWAQRVHQFQALQGSGLTKDRLLVADRPPPSLSGGEPFMIAYADNLNIGGLDQERVQAAKEGAVSRLRSLGFGIHEEVEAANMVDSLGFRIDGVNGIVLPIPEKVGKVISAFRWLSKRPRTTGKDVEKLIGHAVHFIMLRREMLSVLRALYDFVQSCYHRRCRLWKTAAGESRILANLLCICYADLRRPWSPLVTCSDASLSGIAVSSKQTDTQIVASIARHREGWRFKHRDFRAPREAALTEVQNKPDPFTDVETVLPIHQQLQDPYLLDDGFPEVPLDFMDSSGWVDSFSTRMTIEEPITVLESRGTIAAARHRARGVGSFYRRMLRINDNLANVLGLEKGRSASFPMLRACRRLCAILVALNSVLYHRWVPSEHNPSDHASRRWESLRVQKKTVKQTSSASPAAFASRRRSGKSRACLSQAYKPATGSNFENEEIFNSEGHSREHQGGEGSETPSVGGDLVNETFPNPIVLGAGGSFSRCSSGLYEEIPSIHKVCQDSQVEDLIPQEVRRELDRLSQQLVSGRIRYLRRKQNVRGRHRCAPRLFPQSHDGKIQKMLAWLDKSGPRRNQTSNPLSVGSPHCLLSDQGMSRGSCAGGADDVFSISSAGRGVEYSGSGCGETFKSSKTSCNQLASHGETGNQQNWIERRINYSRLTGPTLSGNYDGEVEGAKNSGTLVHHQLQPVEESMGQSHHSAWTKEELGSSIPASSFRAVSRSAPQSAHGSCSEVERQVGVRCVSETVRGPQQAGSGVSKPSATGARGCTESGEGPRVDDAKISIPIGLDTPRPWVVELFAGCANLSHACCREGFRALSLDILYGPGCDLLKSSVVSKLFHFLRNNWVALVWLGMPCNSWSRARKYDDLGPPPLRDDDEYLWGLPNLSKADQRKVQQGNQLLMATYNIIQYCIKHNIPWALENPWTSRAWLTSPLQELLRSGQLQRVDFCQFGTPWRKATGIMASPDAWLKPIMVSCEPANGRCSKTGRKHIILQGTDASGTFLTMRAQPYPKGMCKKIAIQLKSKVFELG